MLTGDALPDDIRTLLEERFWRPIERSATIEALRESGAGIDDAAHDPFLFADHGVVHVRDIARGVISLAESANGLLLPLRPPERQRFLVAYGVTVTYLHDIGMVDPTPEGRRVHPAFAAHTAFGPELDDVVEHLLGGPSPMVARLRHVQAVSPFEVPLPVIVREVLSLSMAHSKTAVPAAILDDPVALRQSIQSVVLTELDALRAGASPSLDSPWPPSVRRFYGDLRTEPFAWLTSDAPAHVELVDDVVDALRVLRAADALRQRGTTLRTAGGYEVFMEAATGEAVYSLRSADRSELFFLRVEGTRSAGEANIRTAWITPSGQLRVSFHRGAYGSAAARARAVAHTAEVVDDIQADVLPSFGTSRTRLALPPAARDPREMTIELERPRDAPGFATEVAFDLLQRQPALVGRVAVVANLEDADPGERDRYHRAAAIPPGTAEARSILLALQDHGMSVDDVDPAAAFSDVRRITVAAGEVLVAAGSPPAFVYVPTEPGLRVVPGGGYPEQPAGAWLPLGVTGVVRDAARNSDVVADHDVEVVMVPGELFLREWFRPTSADRLHGLLHH